MSTSRFVVRLCAVPGALERVLQPFSVFSLVPRHLTFCSAGDGFAELMVEYDGLAADQAGVLVERIARIPVVDAANLDAGPRMTGGVGRATQS